MFFLRYLDIIEQKEEQRAKSLGAPYSETLKSPYRWRDWAAPFDSGMVIDEGVMFYTKTAAYQQTKRKLLDECDLWCVVSLPQGVFVNAGFPAPAHEL